MKALDQLATHWPEISRLLDQALALPASEREGWLHTLPGASAPMRETLQRLLQAHAEAESGDFLGSLPPLQAPAALAPGGGPAAGDHVGPYRLLEPIGQGGMGQVWLAERDDGSLRRRVALKLPHAAWSDALAQRMGRERDILSRLEHPHIARLYDAGVDAQGRPYLALEYVQGQPIDVYALERGLAVAERLRLLLQVMAAVAYAHGRLVVHRDLKPSNILVTSEGEVRLLDFGIAKLIVGDHAEETQLTQVVGRALTLDYASPEQIRGEPIGTASDVYSLGVVAYELLTGTRPYRLERGGAAELERAIQNTDPAPASSAAGDAQVARALRGDLDAILSKALKKSVDERYASVEALVQDIERWFAGQPVLARPDSLAYRARRFVHRHRVQVAAGGLVALALVAGSGVALWQAAQARSQAARAESVAGFMRSLFASASTTRGATVDTRAVDLLLAGRERALAELRSQPQLAVDTLEIIGESLLALSASPEAAVTFGRALEIERARPAPDAARARKLTALRASAFLHHGDFAAAGPLLSELEAQNAGSTTPDAVDVLVRNGRANWYFMQGRHREAVEASRLAVDTARAAHGESSRAFDDALVALGQKQQAQGDHAGALETLARAEASIARAARGPADRELRTYIHQHRANALAGLRRFDEAARSFEAALAEQRSLYGARSMHVGTTLSSLGNLRFDEGDFAAAIETLRESLAIVIEAKALPLYEGTENSRLARAHREARHHAEALALYERAAAQVEQGVGERHSVVYRDRGHAGVQRALTGDIDAGLAQAQKARQALLELGENPHAKLTAAELALQMATPLLLAERYGEAAAQLDAFEREGQALGLRAGRRLAAEQIGRGHLALARGDAAGARALFQQALQTADATPRGTSAAARVLPEHSLAWMALAELAWRDARSADKAALDATRRDAEAALQYWSRLAPESRWQAEAALWLGLLDARSAHSGTAIDAQLAAAVRQLGASPFARDRRLVQLAARR